MKKAIIVVSFGTSHKDAREKSLDMIYSDIKKVCRDKEVYQAYTSGMIIKKLLSAGIEIYNIEEAVKEALKNGADALYIVPTHIIHGHEYDKITALCEKYRDNFKEIKITPAVLENKEDCKKIVSVLNNIMAFNKRYEYVLMGHGSDAEANIRYEEMNESLKNEGFTNVHIALVEANPDLNDVLNEMRKPCDTEKVMVQPFMVVAGDHAKNDMAGDENSYVAKLKELGYNTEAVIKGLGEYSEFRKIYIDNLMKLI